ncbi:MAG TPA: PEP-CTERM sorting domain-containing protein, partial [Phycisphaerae bacterium]|nr:PEP-CTERM sorting domain-containing protein [Phycisphaerae bacterium]
WDSFKFTGFAQVPEPATMLLLFAGAVAMLKRRRRDR